MIVWGGYMPGDLLNIGGMYDPVSNTWQRTTQVAAPEARERHTAAWTGTRMIVWGGDVYALGGTRSGALYDPKADSWTPMSESGAPPKWVVPPRAIWAGDRFFVFTTPTEPLSTPTEPLLAVASYDPAMDRWTPHSIEGGPSPRFVAVRVAWDGCRLVLWGGDVVGDSITPRGWLYTPPRE
jgi:hypothetical protein